ncbi:MAG: PDZ domain-containing protein, partial [Motiliproteus sp.]
AMEVVDQLKERGFVARGWLGVYIQEVNKDLAESFGLEKPAGALVTKVTPNSPAEKAGLKEGDIIVSFNGGDIQFSTELPHLVGRVTPGTKVNVFIVRDGNKKNIDLVVGELERDQAQVIKTKVLVPEKNVLAIEVLALEQARKSKWSLNGGVVVRKVLAGPGAEAGLLVGDVITSLHGQNIDSIEAFNEVVKRLPEDKFIRVRIVRRGNSQYLPIKIKG